MRYIKGNNNNIIIEFETKEEKETLIPDENGRWQFLPFCSACKKVINKHPHLKLEIEQNIYLFHAECNPIKTINSGEFPFT